MGDSIRKLRNEIILNFAERGENFTLNVPHKGKWLSIIAFLRKRGFKITENPSYKEHYKCLSRYHKIGFKGAVVCLMEINPASIAIEFGHQSNLTTGATSMFWKKGDSYGRYSHISYLEENAINLEIKRLLDRCVSLWKMELKPERSSLAAVEFILNKNAENKHIHGGPKTMQELAEAVKLSHADPYQGTYNLVDKHKKPIYCGETKYFYDEYRGNRLMRGIVHHNINNMWWVILPCGQLRNIACFHLFDWSPELTRRKKLSRDEQIKRIEKCYESAFQKKDYGKVYDLSRSIMLLKNEFPVNPKSKITHG